MPPARLDDEFVALPVGKGDAFFLRRGEFTALIDGGISRGGFCELFRMTLRRNDVNVLVCTHNDASAMTRSGGNSCWVSACALVSLRS
jgi:beta-lactamase superfamily II metal-dependent hydrolase